MKTKILRVYKQKMLFTEWERQNFFFYFDQKKWWAGNVLVKSGFTTRGGRLVAFQQ